MLCNIKGCTWLVTILGLAVEFKQSSISIKWSDVCQLHIPNNIKPPPEDRAVDTKQIGFVDFCHALT